MSDKRAEEGIVWDEDYNNPGAELVMISSDNVGFRSHVWNLKKESKFFADLVLVAGHNDTDQNPIRVDQSALAVRVFLDLIYLSKKQTLDFDLEWSTCAQVIAICDQFQAPEIDKRFLYDLANSKALEQPQLWELFRLANRREDLELAKLVIPRFNLGDFESESSTVLATLKTRGLEGITASWILQLLLGRFAWSHGRFGGMNVPPRTTWLQVAQQFNP